MDDCSFRLHIPDMDSTCRSFCPTSLPYSGTRLVFGSNLVRGGTSSRRLDIDTECLSSRVGTCIREVSRSTHVGNLVIPDTLCTFYQPNQFCTCIHQERHSILLLGDSPVYKSVPNRRSHPILHDTNIQNLNCSDHVDTQVEEYIYCIFLHSILAYRYIPLDDCSTLA